MLRLVSFWAWPSGSLQVSSPDTKREQGSLAASVIQHILQSPLLGNPNVPVAPGSNTTALHVASEIGRADAGMFC
jgi:hypothetical protein